MDRRRARRIVRRLRVTLTDLERGSQHPGFTVNLSATGMLIATPYPPELGARVRAEIRDPQHAVSLECMVVRYAQSESLDDEAVAVRFLEPREILLEVAPDVPAVETVLPMAEEAGLEVGEVEPAGSFPLAVDPWAPAGEFVLRDPTEEIQPGAEPPQPSPPVAEVPPPERRAAPPPPPRPAITYRVALGSSAELRRRYEQEIRYGGLFILDSNPPPPLNALLTLEVALPDAGPPLPVVARVVQHVAYGAPGSRGFAVEFDDHDEVARCVAAMLERAPG
jgi:hypothetical protein